MVEVGILNMGLNYEELGDLVTLLGEIVDPEMTFNTFDYRTLDPTEISNNTDIFVVSPGNARVGLPNVERVENDPYVLLAQLIIQNAIYEGIPSMFINGGYEAAATAVDNAIDKVLDLEGYKKKQTIAIDSKDPLFEGIDEITFELTNGHLVYPPDIQKHRWGQHEMNPLIQLGRAEHGPGVLVARFDSKAPVYGVQFNIEAGTKQVFENFFQLASQYLENKRS